MRAVVRVVMRRRAVVDGAAAVHRGVCRHGGGDVVRGRGSAGVFHAPENIWL